MRMTPREQEIVDLRCRRGMSCKEVAAHLRISDHTVRKTIYLMMRRNGMAGRAAMTAFCYQYGRSQALTEMGG